MLCTNCKKTPASVHFKSVINDQVTEWDLCPACAQEKGLTVMDQGLPLSPAPFQSLSELIAQLADVSGYESRKSGPPQCGHCGLTYPEFHVRGRFGCAHCFDAFSHYVQPLLQHIHGHAHHAGKSYDPPSKPTHPSKEPSAKPRTKHHEAELLQKQLKEAIKHEEFEKAAEIRDKLRQLKEGA